MVRVEFPQPLAVELAQRHVGEGLDPVAHRVVEGRLEAEEVAGQAEVDDLPPCSPQGSGSGTPSPTSTVKRWVESLLLVEQDGAGTCVLLASTLNVWTKSISTVIAVPIAKDVERTQQRHTRDTA